MAVIFTNTAELTPAQRLLINDLAAWMMWWLGLDDSDALPIEVQVIGEQAEFVAAWGDTAPVISITLPDVSASENDRSYIGKTLALRWSQGLDLAITRRGQLLVRS
ncbi:MAG TPA: hypothetical protein PKD09_09385 [Aggregatilinea sp.]|uniref:hypothetical protein n=1 Tax=Aggregatilinea sp. TaxID=2806333 RepID=UPI002C2330E8|nr:hypothetical protein [Aggregatilinea sp.]HML21849.1 hypothetical protein [Aggregatilinea sp.]